MGAPARISQMTPTATPLVIPLPLWFSSVSGVNHSGARAYLQVYSLGVEPTDEVPLYSYPEDDLRTVSIVADGGSPQIPGEKMGVGCVVVWSSSPGSYVPVEGTWNFYGQLAE